MNAATRRYIDKVIGPQEVDGVYRRSFDGETYRVDAITRDATRWPACCPVPGATGPSPSPPSTVTPLDGGHPAADGTGREATSSASDRRVVADMLALLDARPGERVLEIGTGTVLMVACWRAGPCCLRFVVARPLTVVRDLLVSFLFPCGVLPHWQNPRSRPQPSSQYWRRSGIAALRRCASILAVFNSTTRGYARPHCPPAEQARSRQPHQLDQQVDEQPA